MCSILCLLFQYTDTLPVHTIPVNSPSPTPHSSPSPSNDLIHPPYLHPSPPEDGGLCHFHTSKHGNSGVSPTLTDAARTKYQGPDLRFPDGKVEPERHHSRTLFRSAEPKAARWAHLEDSRTCTGSRGLGSRTLITEGSHFEASPVPRVVAGRLVSRTSILGKAVWGRVGLGV